MADTKPQPQLLSQLPFGEKVVSMVQFDGKVFVASTTMVWVIWPDMTVRALEFEYPPGTLS